MDSSNLQYLSTAENCLWRSVQTTVRTLTTCKLMPNVRLFWRKSAWPAGSCEAETTKESIETKTESGNCFCIPVV